MEESRSVEAKQEESVQIRAGPQRFRWRKRYKEFQKEGRRDESEYQEDGRMEYWVDEKTG
jgi:hypothetical protein